MLRFYARWIGRWTSEQFFVRTPFREQSETTVLVQPPQSESPGKPWSDCYGNEKGLSSLTP